MKGSILNILAVVFVGVMYFVFDDQLGLVILGVVAMIDHLLSLLAFNLSRERFLPLYVKMVVEGKQSHHTISVICAVTMSIMLLQYVDPNFAIAYAALAFFGTGQQLKLDKLIANARTERDDG